jgi:hypothetical protein
MLGHSIPEIERTDVIADQMAAFTSESEFTGVSVSLMVETASYCCLAAGTMGDRETWDRDTAAVAGNMVRQYKLLDSFLDQICQRREETGRILARLVFETTVNIRFLIKHFSSELIDSYISHSMRHERKLHDVIQGKIKDRGGIMLPIEDRMLQSIDRAAKGGSIQIDEIDLTDRSPWGGKNTFDKAKDVGLEQLYLASFGGGSHSIHGNWQEIYANHIEWDGACSFTPKMQWRTPRPQLITSMALMINETSDVYFNFIGGAEVGEYFGVRLQDLQKRIHRLVKAHETYLSAKQWPNI